MKFVKCITSLFMSIVLILSLSACNSTDKAYLYFNLSETPSTLDPQIAETDTELLIVRNIFEGLLRKDKNGKIVCGVAESFEKKGLTYTFTLRKNAVWSDNTPITANDFVFAFKRAVLPETEAPFVSRLFCIKNAKSINKGKKSVEKLGISAVNNHTLKITLSEDDENFCETLTTSIAMPCNEEFFNKSSGKYCLESETTLSNGSYKLIKWGKDIFGIRLYRNSDYKGNFYAENAAVFISADNDRNSVSVLTDGDADITFINSQDLTSATQSGLKTCEIDNICWFLTLSDDFSKNMRKALITLAHPQVFSKDLNNGYTAAKSIYPPFFNTDVSYSGMPVYDLDKAKKLFKSELKKTDTEKFPSDITLYYYDDGFSKTIVTDIVAHWQNQLGAYINIKSVSSPALLISQLKKQTYSLGIFPVSADSPNLDEYLKKFTTKYSGKDLDTLQTEILSSKNIVPIMAQKTAIAYTDNLTGVNFTLGNGYIDFAYIVKSE